jgi:CRISPR/Cas system-associated exonuclease Cas4 (RecB family)
MITRLSKSAVNTYNSCPRKYFLQYVEKVEQQKQELMENGKHLHEIYELFYKNLPPIVNSLEDFSEVFEEIYKRETNEDVKRNLRHFFEMNVETFKDLKEKGLERCFKPILIEEKIESSEIGFVGVIDAVFELPDKILIIDWKTTKYAAGKEKDYRLELAGYKELFVLKYPTTKPVYWGIFFSEDGVFFIEESTEEAVVVFHKKLELARSHIDQGHFEKPKLAPCKWCGFFEACWSRENAR